MQTCKLCNKFHLEYVYICIRKKAIEWPRQLLYIIGITYVFLCIYICKVPRKVFEHEAYRLSEGPGKC